MENRHAAGRPQPEPLPPQVQGYRIPIPARQKGVCAVVDQLWRGRNEHVLHAHWVRSASASSKLEASTELVQSPLTPTPFPAEALEGCRDTCDCAVPQPS